MGGTRAVLAGVQVGEDVCRVDIMEAEAIEEGVARVRWSSCYPERQFGCQTATKHTSYVMKLRVKVFSLHLEME